MAFQKQIEDLEVSLNGFYDASSKTYDTINNLWNEYYELDPSKPKDIKRQEDLQKQIDYSQGQVEQLEAKAREVEAQIEKIRKSRDRKQNEAAAAAQAAENERIKEETNNRVNDAEAALETLQNTLAYWERQALDDSKTPEQLQEITQTLNELSTEIND